MSSSTTTTVTLNGSCLCKWITFTVALPQSPHPSLSSSGKLAATNCHCTICRNSVGSVFGTWVHVPAEFFTLSDLAMNIGTYRSSETVTRKFCRTCGTSLFCAEDGWAIVPEDKSVGNLWYNRRIKGKEGRLIDIAIGAIDDGDVKRHVEIVEHTFLDDAVYPEEPKSLPRYTKDANSGIWKEPDSKL